VKASFEPGDDRSLHPAKQAAIAIAGSRVGVVGELHPEVAEAFEISGTVYLFEINLIDLLPFTTGHKIVQPLPRFPSIVRDVALIIDAETSHQQVQDIIRSFPLVSQVAVFDVYTGEQVPAGKKSLAYSITFQSPAHTLTDEEADKVQQQILDKLSHQLGSTLRT
jgi:phenylalanyl-tRNA synthetase beta chain